MFDKGDSVWFFLDDIGWHTGVFMGVVEKAKESSENFGMLKVKPNFLERKQVLVRPGNVEAIVDSGLSELLE